MTISSYPNKTAAHAPVVTSGATNPTDNHGLFAVATKIQKVYKGHKVRVGLTNGISLIIRRRIIQHMEALTAYIMHSPSADMLNSDPEKGLTKEEKEIAHRHQTFRTEQITRLKQVVELESIDNVESTNQKTQNYLTAFRKKIIEELIYAVKERVAVCSDFAIILYCMLQNDPLLPIEFKENLKMARLREPDDHCFLIFNNDLILDAWFGHINLPAHTGIRENAVKAKGKTPANDSEYSIHRTRGFIGPKGDFLAMLTKEGEDNIFVKCHGKHEIVVNDSLTELLYIWVKGFAPIVALIPPKPSKAVKENSCCVIC